MDSVEIDGTIVIGEGERDGADAVYREKWDWDARAESVVSEVTSRWTRWRDESLRDWRVELDAVLAASERADCGTRRTVQ